MRTIFVCGPMRSGTSLTAKLFASHPGYSFGPGPVNHNGENCDFMAKNREVMRCTAGGATRGIPTSADRIAAPLRVDLENWLRYAESEEQGEGVVLKDPRACFALGIWLSLVEDAAVVVTLRDPPCIVESLVRTQRMDRDEAVENVALYYDCLFRNLARHKVPTAFLNYENLLTSPLDALGPVLRKLGMQLGDLDLMLLDKGQWHFRPEAQ